MIRVLRHVGWAVLLASAALAEPIDVTSREAALLGDAHTIPTSSAELDDYIRYALTNNAGLRAAVAHYHAALEADAQRRALPDPRVLFTHFVEEIQTRTGAQRNRLQLEQRIPWPGKLRRSGEVVTERAEGVWYLAEAEALELTRTVKTAYYEYAYLYHAVDILEQNLSLLKDLEPIVQRRVQTGAGFDALLRLQVEIGKLENELESTRERRPSISTRLTSLMNIERGSLLPWPRIPIETPPRYRFEDLADRIDRANPELRAMRHGVRVEEHRGALARAEGRPDFVVGVTYIDTGEAHGALQPSDSGDDPWGLTLGMSLPIARGKYKAGIRAAEASRDAARFARDERRNELVWQLETNVYHLDDDARQANLYNDTLIPRARQALELTEAAYESGNAGLLDLIDSQRELLTFELGYRRAVIDGLQRLAALEAICGGQLP